jgi:hypothetical protein
MNFFEVSGIPLEFGIVLLTLGLVLFLSPYFSGVDFGVIKIPKLKGSSQKRLKVIGPLILLLFLVLFFPIWTQFFSVTLSPIFNWPTSSLVGRSVRISWTKTDYRIEMIVKNASLREDELISHIMIVAYDDGCDQAQAQSYSLNKPADTLFTISDTLLVQPASKNNRLKIQGDVREDQSTDFAYGVDGYYEIRLCEGRQSHLLLLGFDSAIDVPINSSVQFNVLIPRDLKVIYERSIKESNNTNNPAESENTDAKSMNVDPLLNNPKDILKSLPNVYIEIWDSARRKAISFETDSR